LALAPTGCQAQYGVVRHCVTLTVSAGDPERPRELVLSISNNAFGALRTSDPKPRWRNKLSGFFGAEARKRESEEEAVES
jgi:hypothetical protein